MQLERFREADIPAMLNVHYQNGVRVRLPFLSGAGAQAYG